MVTGLKSKVVLRHELFFREPSDRDRCPVHRNRLYNHIYSRTVRETSVYYRFRCIDRSSNRGYYLVDNIVEFLFRRKLYVGKNHLSAFLDKNPVIPRNHDLTDVFIPEQHFQRTKPHYKVIYPHLHPLSVPGCSNDLRLILQGIFDSGRHLFFKALFSRFVCDPLAKEVYHLFTDPVADLVLLLCPFLRFCFIGVHRRCRNRFIQPSLTVHASLSATRSPDCILTFHPEPRTGAHFYIFGNLVPFFCIFTEQPSRRKVPFLCLILPCGTFPLG